MTRAEYEQNGEEMRLGTRRWGLDVEEEERSGEGVTGRATTRRDSHLRDVSQRRHLYNN